MKIIHTGLKCPTRRPHITLLTLANSPTITFWLEPYYYCCNGTDNCTSVKDLLFPSRRCRHFRVFGCGARSVCMFDKLHSTFMWRFQKNQSECHLNVTYLVVHFHFNFWRVNWRVGCFFTSHVTCQILHCARQLMCKFFSTSASFQTLSQKKNTLCEIHTLVNTSELVGVSFNPASHQLQM